MGISARANMPGVGFTRLGFEARLHPVKRQVEHAVLELKARERAWEGLGDQRLRSLLERNICGCAGDKRQSTGLDEARTIIFTLDRGLVCTVLKVLQETGGQSGEVTLKLQLRGSHEGGIRGEMDRLELHYQGEPVGQVLFLDGKELTGTVSVGALPNQKDGVQDRNEAVFIDGE